MTDTPANSGPQVPNALSPHLVCAGAVEAIDFYKAAFGATEMVRFAGKDGRLMHACISINGYSVMLIDEMPEWGALSPKSLNGTPVTMHLIVDDTDAWAERAQRAGATVVMPVDDMFWGDRYGIVQDPFGHKWALASHQRDVSPEEIQAAAAAM